MLEYFKQVEDILVARGSFRGLTPAEIETAEEAFKRGNGENDCAALIIEMRNAS